MDATEQYAALLMKLPEVYQEVADTVAGSAEAIAALKAYKVRTEQLLLLIGQHIESYEARQRDVLKSLHRVANYLEQLNHQHDLALGEDSDGDEWKSDSPEPQGG